MKLTVLGTCGGYPGPDDAASGYLIRSDAGATIWMDAGSGTMSNLQKHVGLHDVDAIVLSHQHPDHHADVHGYWIACKYGDNPRSGIPIYAPQPTIEAHRDISDSPTFVWNAVADGDDATVGDVALRFSRTDHPVETVGVLARADGRTLGFSADTGDEWSFAEFHTTIDLALCEATGTRAYEDRWKHVHLSGWQAGQMARDAGAARLLLTHIWGSVDRALLQAEAEETFGGPVEIAVVNQTYEV